jgi:GNAT superfamily N-acetyltransferase
MTDVLEIVAGYRPGVIGRITQVHGEYYAARWGVDARFEGEVARELGDFVRRFDPARSGLWTVWSHDGVVGAIAIDGQSGEPGDARLRWFILDPDYQGRGIGRRLMTTAMDFCAQAGHRRVYLWTAADLDAARALYEAFGFTLVEEYEDGVWGAPIRHQRYEVALTPGERLRSR